MDFITTAAFSKTMTNRVLGREKFASSAGSNEEIHRSAMPVNKARRVEAYKGGKYEKFTGSDGPGPVWTILGILIGVYAVYLSWSCNTKQGVTVIPKIIYGVFAWIFGTLYLILYFFMRRPC